MEDNHIGAILVQHEGRLQGVLTDRDLALRVVGGEIDLDTRVADVMTRDPVTISVSEDESRAVALMRQRAVRRLPIMDANERVVGLVTLDDLLLSRALDPVSAAELMRAQLSEPARSKPAGQTHPSYPAQPKPEALRAQERHAAHAEQSSRRAAHIVQDMTGLPDPEKAGAALEVVVTGLMRRVQASEAADFLSQLPTKLRERVLDAPAGPDRSVTRETIEADMSRQLAVDAAQASRLVQSVASALARLVSEGQLEQLRGLLPKDLRTIIPQPAPG